MQVLQRFVMKKGSRYNDFRDGYGDIYTQLIKLYTLTSEFYCK